MFRYVRLEPGSRLPHVSDLEPFKAIVVIERRPTQQWQDEVSRWLVNSGCLYMMAWGPDCGSWDDSVDYANMKAFDYGDIPDISDVMTTWHETDTLAEVFKFAKEWAQHPAVNLDNLLVCHIGTDDRRADFEELFDTA
ncbi:MAG: hypothetical protein ACFCVH_03440 [Alphaproteobacteria bacterium]